MRKLTILCLTLILQISVFAQQPKKPNSSQIFESIKKLNFLGSVLYVAAHPDDENTRLISYMANNLKARTAYLSITRGDGGQNLIGPEIRELLGVIRTQELLAARKIDGGEQMFTRANDFGYSKHPDETLAIWDKEKVLSDVVWAIRKFQPDVIINRFNHRTPGSTHGHHTSSAMLSIEAFDLVNDESIYPDQLKYVGTWQPKRLFFNTGWWFYGSRENFDKADKTGLLAINTGVFYPSFGLSNPEIAAMSRSQHKSQGFGSTGTRGKQLEYIEIIKGELPSVEENIFEGIDTSWNRVKDGKAIGTLLEKVQNSYDFTNPSASIPELTKAYAMIQKLNDSHWKTVKSQEIKNIIAASAGLYLETVANSPTATNGSEIELSLEAINRSDSKIILENFKIAEGATVEKGIYITNNTSFKFEEILSINDQSYTTPYWLTEKGTLGMYKVQDQLLIGKPETPRDLNVTFNLIIENVRIPFTKTIVYKTNDPVKGEVYKPFEIIPEVSVRLGEKVVIFENDQQKEIPVTIKAGRNELEGSVKLTYPEDWNVYPESHPITIANKGEEQTVVFSVKPPKYQSEGHIKPEVVVNDHNYSVEMIEIDYEHIPYQTIVMPSESKIVRLDIQKKGENIGYIEGAGDVVPESLKQIGYNVVTIKPEDINQETLSRFDAIVVGIRAYNIVDQLKYKQKVLFDFVDKGGNMIVQYNTSRRLKVDELAPYPLKLGRDRVTDEFAEVRFINPEHELMNFPNKITQDDFKGWTQERGLYFPSEWSDEFKPILSINDKGETPKEGSLLVAKHGDGHYIYTGLSFFREFPAGVPGAYRLFANMLSIGKDNLNINEKLKD
ncbi:MAG: PIG-L family deacetylase [Flavobacteriaceae bacterium]|nr:PIG-L family deacetylase [Bacteroidia bacterium]NNL61019.1 PIG-L family deacetylase [Flavobacteriaceae bacterium]